MYKKNLIVIWLLLFSISTIMGQEYEIDLLEYHTPVEGPPGLPGAGSISNSKWFLILDEKSEPPAGSNFLSARPSWLSSTETYTIAWKEDGTTRPVAYVSGSFPRVKARFKKSGGWGIGLGCNTASKDVWVRGKWVANVPGGEPPVIVGPIKATVSGSTATIGPVAMNFPLRQTTKCFTGSILK